LKGLFLNLWATEKTIVEKKLGRCSLCEEFFMYGRLFEKQVKMIVDNICSPTPVYGIADGKGNFLSNLSES